MGCKCTNSNEEEDEINKNVVEDGNDAQSPNDFNNNFNKDENLLGFNNQENVNQELNNQDNQIENSNNDQPYNIDENAFYNIQNVPLQYNKYSDYPEKIVELINNIREDPVGYADVIEDSIKYIVEEEDKNDPSNARLIFKKKLK